MTKLDQKRKRLREIRKRVSAKKEAADLKACGGLKRPHNIQDHDVEKRIPPSFGVGLKYKSHGRRYITVGDEKPRRVILDVRSWVGVSMGAIHYYGHLKYFGVSSDVIGGSEDDSVYTSDAPDASQSGDIELTRKLTAKDEGVGKSYDDYVAFGGGNRFAGYEVGEPTNCFDTEDDVIEKAKKEFKRIFGSGWKLVTD